jgi:hypothetical protein
MPHASSREAVVAHNTFNYLLRLSHFPLPWKEANVITLPKPCKDLKFPHNICMISLLFTTGDLFEKAIIKIVQRQVEEKNLLHVGLLGFNARHTRLLNL